MIRLYKLYGTTELKGLTQSVTNKANHWFSEWSGANEGLQSLHIVTGSDVRPELSELYGVSYDIDESIMGLAVDKRLYKSFPALLLPMNAMGDECHSSMVDEILNEVFFDLLKPYTKLAGLKNAKKKSLMKPSTLNFNLSDNTGDVLVKMEFLKGSIYLQLPYTVIAKMNLQMDEKKPKPVLAKRGECAISGDIKLTVNVGGAEVDFGSVIGMRKGDVIRLDSKMVDKMEVTTNDGEFVCNAYLGKQDNKKVIKVII